MKYFDWRALLCWHSLGQYILQAAAQYELGEHLRAIKIKYYASMDRRTGAQTLLDEWHVSDPLYDNDNTNHLLHFINGAALERAGITHLGPGLRHN